MALARTNPTFREHLLLGAIVIAYSFIALVVAALAGVEGTIRFRLYLDGLTVLLPVSALLAAIIYLMHMLLVVRPTSPFSQLQKDFHERLHWRERLWVGLPMIPLFSVFMSVFSSWKVMIPELQPFRWDPVLHGWDLWLHGGVEPWRWLQPWLGTPLRTSVINFLYNVWIFAVYFTLIWQMFSLRNRALRLQFLLAFLCSWMLLGNLAATWLSSAGPCYFGAATGLADPYLPLMEYLHAAAASHPVWSLDVQAGLWADYQANRLKAAAGISAMPSMHVSSTLLIALLMRRTHWCAGWAAAAFLAAILLGSVHLGWHYAVDGYVSLLATVLIWHFCGRIVAGYCPANGNPHVPSH